MTKKFTKYPSNYVKANSDCNPIYTPDGETLWAVVVTDDAVFVRQYTKDLPNEHTSGVFLNKVGACNTARKIARQFGLQYIPQT